MEDYCDLVTMFESYNTMIGNKDANKNWRCISENVIRTRSVKYY